LVADVISGFLVAAMVSTSVFVYVVAWLAFNSSWGSTYVVAAFGVSRLSTSVLAYMLVAVSDPDIVTVVGDRISVATADALAKN
jgi:hypothetical protein